MLIMNGVSLMTYNWGPLCRLAPLNSCKRSEKKKEKKGKKYYPTMNTRPRRKAQH